SRAPPSGPRPEYGPQGQALSPIRRWIVGFLDKAMRTANELAGKAETALNQSGMTLPGSSGGVPGGERLYAQLGRLVHEEHRGQPVDPARRAQLLAQLDELAERASSAPPPPGSASTGAAPPPP